MPKMIANQGFEYGGARLKKGSEFSATTRDARVLALVGRATYAPTEEKLSGLEASAVIVDEVPPARPRRQYRRRDMQAEG